jgi:hypothetical protein
VPYGSFPDGFNAETQKAQQQDVLGRHGDVGFQLAAPPARGILAL